MESCGLGLPPAQPAPRPSGGASSADCSQTQKAEQERSDAQFARELLRQEQQEVDRAKAAARDAAEAAAALEALETAERLEAEQRRAAARGGTTNNAPLLLLLLLVIFILPFPSLPLCFPA